VTRTPKLTPPSLNALGAAAMSLLGSGGALAQDRPQTAPSQAPSAAASAQKTEEVMVTAQRRSERLQHVPISMTVLSEKSLLHLNVQSLQDVARQTPSLVVVSAGPGQNELIIRGISSTAGTTSTVGYYLDDIPLQPSSNAALLSSRGAIDPALFDLERVEVLRGPQGTLYGSSSMGGTVRYVTHQPDTTTFAAKLQTDGSVTDGGGPNDMVNATLNIPLVRNSLALRVTGFQRYESGFIDRYRIDPGDITKIAPLGLEDSNVNTENTKGIRIQLRWEVDPTLSVTPSYFYQYSRIGAPFQVDVPPGGLDDLIQTRDTRDDMEQRSSIANLAIHKTLPFVELVSSTSYFDREVKIHEDTSKVIDYFFSPPQTSVYPVGMVGTYFNKEFTQEVRAISALPGPFQIVAGGYFHRTYAPLNSVIADPPGYDATFGSPFGGELFYAGAREATLQEEAVFAEGTLKLGHGVSAVGGVRYFEVDQRFFQSGDGVLNGGHSEVSNSSTDTGVNPKYGLNWQIDPDHLVYAAASRGYRPGGPNNPAPAAVCGGDVAGLGLSDSELVKYNPDHLWNYELGAKTGWFDDRLTVNGALYYIDWQQVQQQIVLGCGYNITANFGSATSKGGEFEVAYRVTPRLRLSGGFGYTDAHLNNGIPGTGASSGDTLQDVPHWNATATAEYSQPLTPTLSGFGLANVTYTGDSHALYDRTSPYYLKKGYTLVNLRIGVTTRSGWEAALYASNLLNTIGETDLPTAISADLPTTRRYAVNIPRTVGLSMNLHY
jgi:iron complex outermembrane receptor protein